MVIIEQHIGVWQGSICFDDVDMSRKLRLFPIAAATDSTCQYVLASATTVESEFPAHKGHRGGRRRSDQG